MYKIVVHKRAVRYMRKIPSQELNRIKEAISKLMDWPNPAFNIKQMSGDWKGYHRMRVGKVRVIFWPDTDNKIVYIDHIGPRGDIY